MTSFFSARYSAFTLSILPWSIFGGTVFRKIPAATVIRSGIAYEIAGYDSNVGMAKASLAQSKSNLIMQVPNSNCSPLENSATLSHFEKVASYHYDVNHTLGPVANYVSTVSNAVIPGPTQKSIYVAEKTAKMVDLINGGTGKR